MKALVDTHTLIWALDEPARLGAKATTFLEDSSNDLIVSTATIWELAIKLSLKKLSLSMPYRQWMNRAISDLNLIILPVTLDHADALVGLPFHHRDPFDRLIAVQAIVESLSVVSTDLILDDYGVTRIWN